MNYDYQGITREERELLDQIFKNLRKTSRIQTEFESRMHDYFVKPACQAEGLKSMVWL